MILYHKYIFNSIGVIKNSYNKHRNLKTCTEHKRTNTPNTTKVFHSHIKEEETPEGISLRKKGLEMKRKKQLSPTG